MKLRFYQVDSFTSSVFGGNPAGVCVLNEWMAEETMQKIAMENNLAETAFLVKTDSKYFIRWFTPMAEVALCGHATLAAAHILYNHYGEHSPKLLFETQHSGELEVSKVNDMLQLNFPSDKIKKVEPSEKLVKGIGLTPVAGYKGLTDYLLIYNTQQDVESINPDFALLNEIDSRGVIVSAKGNEVDFVSRFFAPQVGINEDPVTGSAHTTLIPIWSEKLGKHEMIAEQISPRIGKLFCTYKGDRVLIAGRAVTYLEGDIIL